MIWDYSLIYHYIEVTIQQLKEVYVGTLHTHILDQTFIVKKVENNTRIVRLLVLYQWQIMVLWLLTHHLIRFAPYAELDVELDYFNKILTLQFLFLVYYFHCYNIRAVIYR